MNAKQWDNETQAMAKKGLRTVAMAFKEISAKDAKAGLEGINVSGLSLLSLVGIKDPVRPEVPAAVAACKKAGIVVRMVTGDNIDTAKFIARECGIIEGDGDGDGEAMESGEFSKLSDKQIQDLVK